MAELHVILPEREHIITYLPGLTVREILRGGDMRLRSTCGGSGFCGLCRIQIKSGGTLNVPTAAEIKHLSTEQLQDGFRLACQVKPRHDIQVSIENLTLKPHWTPIRQEVDNGPIFPLVLDAPFLENSTTYGVAVDLGTTQIRLSLLDIKKRQRLAGCTGLNPQATFGADVLTRLMAASESDDYAHQIRNLARNAIKSALQDIAIREKISLHDIDQMTIVGNTAMLTLLTGKNYSALLKPEFWNCAVDCVPDESSSWTAMWDLIANASVNTVPPLAGFIGSDLLAGFLATRLTQGPPGSLLIDFGTNSEIALWDGKRIWISSAAGGPAFEGCGISCGMAAVPGAVSKVVAKSSNKKLVLSVIGNGEPQGLCGSGLVDTIAYLIRANYLKANGRYVEPYSTEGFRLNQGQSALVLTQADIDIFQRAKAAVGAVIQCLLAKANLNLQDLQRICVCGAFGQFLNVENAQAIGLLPPVPNHIVELCGNTALAGCELLLLTANSLEILSALRSKTRTINMSAVNEFENQFIRNLYLQTMQTE